ncbi:MAG: hypothetical protein V1907_03555 [Candidatus Kerfeldbacteria bacterium]
MARSSLMFEIPEVLYEIVRMFVLCAAGIDLVWTIVYGFSLNYHFDWREYFHIKFVVYGARTLFLLVFLGVTHITYNHLNDEPILYGAAKTAVLVCAVAYILYDVVMALYHGIRDFRGYSDPEWPISLMYPHALRACLLAVIAGAYCGLIWVS